jgi:hypothetical protein
MFQICVSMCVNMFEGLCMWEEGGREGLIENACVVIHVCEHVCGCVCVW